MTEVAAFIDGLPKAVDQADSVAHIWQCLDDIGVERIDHGVRNSFQIAWLTPADRPLPNRPRHLRPPVGSDVTRSWSMRHRPSKS